MAGTHDETPTDEASLPVATWLDRLSGPHGSPGGGAACAVLVAVSAALLAMVGGYSTHDARVVHAVDRLVAARGRALDAAQADSRRSGELGAALRDDAADDDPPGDGGKDARGDRPAGGDPVPDAALSAARSAVELGDLAASLIPELDLMLETAAAYLMPDLVVAAEAASAALGGSAATARADIKLAAAHGSELTDPDVAEVVAAVERMDAARRSIDTLRAVAVERV